MEEREKYIVAGYEFSSEEDAAIAQNELNKISYIETHSDLNNMDTLLQIYNKALDSRTFCTPIGIHYMHSIFETLSASKIEKERIRPIPLYASYRKTIQPEVTVKKRTNKYGKEKLSLRVKYRNSVITCVILGFIILVMFMITMSGTTPNIMNYKKAVTNKYAQWEQELTERESIIREKERELNINN